MRSGISCIAGNTHSLVHHIKFTYGVLPPFDIDKRIGGLATFSNAHSLRIRIRTKTEKESTARYATYPQRSFEGIKEPLSFWLWLTSDVVAGAQRKPALFDAC